MSIVKAVFEGRLQPGLHTGTCSYNYIKLLVSIILGIKNIEDTELLFQESSVHREVPM